ncbi:putative inorganic carbon transporter subunit DabA [Micromonospora sp. WMMD980]|uniref:putative inorganic carbon transporter subunit DabA n=1 Tax=Micromonospora sp. WMMD980 TaxID=3016088 RepID=UPI002416FD30|nr:putative inorganic carbon transporter subunit DabA [Micromonospora sp. WMMD980]MDG4800334.1 Na-translocating system protein MpsB [Micromonospora sp. WMMD980]
MDVALVSVVLAGPASATIGALTVPDPRRAARVAGALLGLGAVAAAALLVRVATGPAVPAVLARVDTIGPAFSVGVRVDRFTALFVLLVCGLAAVVAGYARRYLDGEPGARALQARVAAATVATLVMATAPSLVQLAVGWIAAGHLLVGLIGHYRDQPRVRVAARRTRRLFLVGDAALVGGFALLVTPDGDADLAAVRATAGDRPGWLLAVAGALLLVAAVVRSAQVPAHRWLPSTLDAPTPVSAFLHAGMVNVAGFLMITLAPVVTAAPGMMPATVLVGLVTAVSGLLFAAVRTDVKGMLARSTIAQMGFMLAQCGLGAFGLAAVHLVGHAVYKAYAFLSAGGTLQAQTRAAAAPRPAGPPSARSRALAATVVVAAVLATELLLGPTASGALGAVLVAAAALAAVRSALADRALPTRAAFALTLAVAALASGYLVAGRATTRWLALPTGTSLLGVGVLVGVLVAVGVAGAVLRRRGNATLWWWAWHDGGVRPRRWANRAGAPIPAALTPPRADLLDRSDGARVVAAAAAAIDHVGAVAPLDAFVAVNPLAGRESVPFARATAELRDLAGARTHLPAAEYRQRLADGGISRADLAAVLPAPRAAGPLVLGNRRVDATDLHLAALCHPVHDGPAPPADLVAVARRRLAELPARPRPRTAPETEPLTLAETLDRALGTRIAADVDDLVAGWCAAHSGRPAALWPVPGPEDEGCWARWRRTSGADPAVARWGVTGLAALVDALPPAPEQAVAALLRAIEVPPAAWSAYLSRSLLRLPGWAGHARWAQTHPGTVPAVSPLDLLAVRLTYEYALAGAAARRHLELPPVRDTVAAATPTSLPAPAGIAPEVLARLAAALDVDVTTLACLPGDTVAALRDVALHLTPSRQSEVWLAAAEHAYRRRLRRRLERDVDRTTTAPPAHAQAVFCIDVRSEGLRRHLEATGPVDTYGFAGFFGLPVRTVTAGARRGRDRCPVLMRPVATVEESPASEQAADAARRRRSGQAWRRAHAAAKAHPVGAFAFVEVAGVLATAALLLRAVAPGRFAPAADHTAPAAADLAAAMTLDEQVYYAEATLRTIGLTAGFAPLVLLCGHGATSANNPYAAALDCGACGGNRGGVSARLVAGLLNRPEVRAALADRGIHLPDGTHVLAGEHDTVTDEVRLFDLEAVPAGRRPEVEKLSGRLAEAGARLRAERAARLPGRPRPRRLPRRAGDWAQVRPEWALAGNAAFVAAPRALTAGVDLGCRTFLHSYDHAGDRDATALETVLTGPLVVAAWINLQYYFSTVDPQRLGAGTKTVHTVLGDALGVLSGSGGDLRLGLPLQSVGDGIRPAHDPLRLLAVIQAPHQLVDAVLGRNPGLRQLVDGGWLSLTVVDPRTGEWTEPAPGGSWLPLPAPHLSTDTVTELPARRPAPAAEKEYTA